MLHGLWAEPNHQKGFVKYQKYIVIHQKTNPLFSNSGKSVWGFRGLPPSFQKSFRKTKRRTAPGRMKLPIPMIIWHLWCFWLCSSIIRNKLTWKYIRLVKLSAPLSTQTASPSYNYPPPSQLPRLSRQPLCPLVSGHLAWQSFILTAPRERKGATKRQKDWGYFDFQTGAPVLPRSSPSPWLYSSCLIPFSTLLNISLHIISPPPPKAFLSLPQYFPTTLSLNFTPRCSYSAKARRPYHFFWLCTA